MTRSRNPRFVFALLGGAAIVAVSLYGFFLLRTRPGLPERIRTSGLRQVDDIRVEKSKDIEFILSQKSVGEWAMFQVQKDGRVETIRAQFAAYYSRVPFPLIYLFIGLFSFLIGFVVFVLKWEDEKARILYWLAMAFSSLLVINGGTYCLRDRWPTYFPALLFYFLYPLAPALLFHFSLAFSRRDLRFAIGLGYCFSLLFSAVFVSAILISSLRSSIEIFRLYVLAFSVFRLYLVALLLLAIFHFIRVYRRADLEENRAQIKWIFLGLLLGVGPFIFTYQIPTALKLGPFLSEEFSSVFFVFAPLGMALSIFKFRLLDVELVINRSLVYSLLTIFTVGVYLFSVRVLQNVFSRMFMAGETAVSLGSAFLAALVFHPARRRIQEFVDRSFFRQSYDYRKAILRFNETIRHVLDQEEMIGVFNDHAKSSIPLDRVAVIVYSITPEETRLVISSGWQDRQRFPLLLCLSSNMVWARHGATHTEQQIDFSQSEALKALRFEVVIPLPFKSSSLAGAVAVGKKKSGARFSSDDIELLITLTGELASGLERIRLQEEVIYERASKEKLDELNRLKTEFVSTVSHELRTPMSSIQGLTEILQDGKIKDKAKKEELVALLASESGRLSRLIHNILDFGKIEQQAKTYRFGPAELRPLIDEALQVFRHKLDEAGFDVRQEYPSAPVFLNIDRDAVKQVLINLIDNAIKYSAERKMIGISLIEKEREVEIQVSDKGIGIPENDLGKIFDKFYRSTGAAGVNPKGVGLGLKIAKHIMAAHHGDIGVESRPGEGSTFRLIFPKS